MSYSTIILSGLLLINAGTLPWVVQVEAKQIHTNTHIKVSCVCFFTPPHTHTYTLFPSGRCVPGKAAQKYYTRRFHTGVAGSARGGFERQEHGAKKREDSGARTRAQEGTLNC